MLLRQYKELKRKRTFSFQRKDYSGKVKKRHDAIIKDFLKFCTKQRVRNIYDITYIQYRYYIRMLHSRRKLSKATIEKTYKYVLKNFFRGALPLILCKQPLPTILPPTEFYINTVG